jgi:hypothetical protein
MRPESNSIISIANKFIILSTFITLAFDTTLWTSVLYKPYALLLAVGLILQIFGKTLLGLYLNNLAFLVKILIILPIRAKRFY